MRRIILILAATAAFATGCTSPVGVRPTGFEPVYRSLTTNVLYEGEPSASTMQLLAYSGLKQKYRERPGEAVELLEEQFKTEHLRAIQLALSELHYDMALRERSRERFLVSAIYAYLYLFDEDLRPQPNPYAPEFRLACDLYNRSLARALQAPGGRVQLEDLEVETPVGLVSLKVSRPGFPWGDEIFSEFLPSDVFEVRGLRERVRDPGLGVPLIAIQSEDTSLGQVADVEGRTNKLAATAFLRLDGGLDELLDDKLSGTVELYLSTDVGEIDVNGKVVPLQTDITTPIAFHLEDAKIWSFGLSGFFSGRTEEFTTGVFQLQPYQEGKIPLVLIHGTASSPATWAQTINGIYLDPALRSKYQVWLAQYNTGNPIAYSASVVREQLKELKQELDPEGLDPALQNMVLVGHSQGGLVTRLLATSSGDRLWNSIFSEPFETHSLDGEARELVEKTVFFEPLPFVSRTVFISTPHKGSYVAGGWLGRMASRMVSLPKDLKDVAFSIFEAEGLPEELRNLPTSVDQMDPDNAFVKRLGSLPFREGLHKHSIIAVKPGSGAIEDGTDGIVKYKSAHLGEAESEFVSRYGHSCQGRPEVILELRRILQEHVQAVGL